MEPLVGASGRIRDEVRKGFMEGSNRVINAVLENKERVNRRQNWSYVVGVESRERGDRGWREWIYSEDNSAEDRTDIGVVLWVIATKCFAKNCRVKQI